MILSPVFRLSTVAGYVLVPLPPTAMWGTSAWLPGRGAHAEVPHVGVGARAACWCRTPRRIPTWHTVPGAADRGRLAEGRLDTPAPGPGRLTSAGAGDRSDERGRPRLRTVSAIVARRARASFPTMPVSAAAGPRQSGGGSGRSGGAGPVQLIQECIEGASGQVGCAVGGVPAAVVVAGGLVICQPACWWKTMRRIVSWSVAVRPVTVRPRSPPAGPAVS